MEQRVLDATLVCIARYGVAKTTLDDVAREAGCARATLYRYFGGKQGLLEAVVAAEGGRLIAELCALASASPTLEDATVAVIVRAAREVAGHQALQFVLAHEPELVLPYLAFDPGSVFLVELGAVLAPAFARFLPAERAARAGEWLARVTLAYTTPERTPVDLTDDVQVRDFVCSFVLPGLAAREPEIARPRG